MAAIEPTVIVSVLDCDEAREVIALAAKYRSALVEIQAASFMGADAERQGGRARCVQINEIATEALAEDAS